FVRAERCGRRRLADEHRLRGSTACRRRRPLHGVGHLHRGRPVSLRSHSLAAAILVSALVPASAGAGAGVPLLALAASPAHLTLTGAADATIRVTNAGALAVVADVTTAGFALGPRGQPRVLAQRPPAWVAVQPAHLTLAPGGSMSLRVS